ncbi:hypothetical protein EI94DRAFT_1773205 [Lactarius quietus]|nr:hypothetical protein EI94DRAFT_1773205 [Lactarius quietus]
MQRRSSHNSRVFACPHKCNLYCRTTGGLTQHRAKCRRNPTNCRANASRLSPTPPQTPSPPSSPLANPFASPAPQTPDNTGRNSHPPTPSSASEQDQHQWTTNVNGVKTRVHPYLNGHPCDADGYDLPSDAPPAPEELRGEDDFFPYSSRPEFELADFLYRTVQMAGTKISDLMDIWAAYQRIYDVDAEHGPPFSNCQDLYKTIDSTEVGDVAWQAFSVEFDGESSGDLEIPSWMRKTYEVWFRDPLQVAEAQIANKDYASEIDYAPKRVFSKEEKRQYSDFMSGNWAWEQADIIAKDPEAHGSMFVPIVLGSDKTTVSVATGQNEYYPLYASIGNVQNHVRRAHRNAVSLVGFLAVPKTDKQHEDSLEFRKFRRQLFHSSLTHILHSLKPWMTKPRITRCGDGHLRRVIYGLGPYIADYPEQVLLSCVVSGWCPKCTARPTNLDDDPTAILRSHHHASALQEAFESEPRVLWDGYGIINYVTPFTAHFPRADIYELLSPDLLHQIIKGTFKDHLVDWVTTYLESVHRKAHAKPILADIDRRIAAAPLFPGLRRFPEGRGFKQWTGDDSKALMKVYLPAIAGHVPPQMVRAIAAFMEFCYLVRRSQLDEDTLHQIDVAVARFHQEREIFKETGVRDDFSLPRQHSMSHYRFLIQQFGAPNGLCSSITESKHIKFVKEPWRRSSRNEPMGEMLLINQRLDKLAAACVDFAARGMLKGPLLTSGIANDPHADIPSNSAHDARDDGTVEVAARGYPKTVDSLAGYLNQPRLIEYIRRFLYDQFHPDAEVCGMDAPLDMCPVVESNLRIKVFHSATSMYHAPSDLSGIDGMHRELIRATPAWKKGPGRYDCVYVEGDTKSDGFSGLLVARVNLFFSFTFQDNVYPCALVQWFSTYGDLPCEDTGLWRVEPDLDARGRRACSVIHIDTILRSAHLIGVAGSQKLPRNFTHHDSLYAFQLFYVNKYADHHSHEIAF